jgi:signal transduction histidine kinase
LAQGEKFAALGQLTGGIVHDMNNHLTTIQTSLGLLNKVSDETLRHKYFTYMQEALNNAIGMLKRLLIFSKGEEEYSLIEMNTMLTASIDLLERAISHKVKLHLDIHSEMQLVWGNYYDLQNILLNID